MKEMVGDMLNQEKNPPCRVCMSLRLFLMAVLAIALMAIINQDLLSFMGKFSISEISLAFIAIFGFFSMLKLAIDYFQIKSKNQ